MGIYQRENGYFYIQIKEDNKYKRISLETKNKYIAQELYNAYLLDKVKSRLYKSQYHSNIHTHQEFNQIEEPNNVCRNFDILSISTLQAFMPLKPIYTQYINQCELQNFTTHTMNGKKQLLQIFQDHRITYIEDLTQENFNRLIKSWDIIKKDTLRKHIANLKAFLNYCIKQKLYKRDDYEAITLPNPKVGIRETTIQEKDYTHIINSTKDDDFKLYMMSLWETGCRPNEITQLKKNDIDFDKGIAKIYQSKTKKYKTVYLTDDLLSIFDTIKNENIFSGYDKQKEYYAKKFKILKDDLDMNKEYCLYAFRHSFGTRMMNKTKDIHLVSKLLGHSDISITAKHYINRSDSEIREKLLSI